MELKKLNKKALKIIIITTVILTLLLITGCNNRRPTIPTYYQGTQGVEIDFLNNMPPSDVFEDSLVSIMLEIWNKGAYTVPDNEVVLNLRFDPVYFKRDDTDPNYLLSQNPEGTLKSISGRSDQWPEGEQIRLPLTKLKVQEIPGTRETPITNIELTSCYAYKTFFSEMICIDTDIYEVDNDPICRNRGTYTYSNQGAPIAINKIEVDMLPMGFIQASLDMPAHVPVINDTGHLIGIAPTTTHEKLVMIEPVIRIYSRNVGRGLVFIPKEDQTGQISFDNLCAFRDETFGLRDHNKVRVSSAKLDGLEMNCGKKTTLNLANPNDFVTCRLHVNQTGYLRQNLQAPLSIELDYYYRTSQTKQIRIQRTT